MFMAVLLLFRMKMVGLYPPKKWMCFLMVITCYTMLWNRYESGLKYLDFRNLMDHNHFQVNKAAILKGSHWKNEYDIKHFTMFDRHVLYFLNCVY